MQRFGWQDTGQQLTEFASDCADAAADEAGRSFRGLPDGPRLWLPSVLPPARPGEWIARYIARLPDRIGRQCVVLLRAGAMAMGYWDEDELLLHKAQKRYVVRGRGRAQPTHLRTRGKSRYGSRLRLQNWQRLLADVNQRLIDWWREPGEPDVVHLAAPVRVVPELFGAEPPPPLSREDPRLRKVPLHVHEPDHEELLRVRAQLVCGRLEPGDSPV